jgi:chromosomal replication initiation ATPase DnaA
MKKAKIIKRRSCLKTRWHERQLKSQDKNLTTAHPVVKASYLWSILSDQLFDALGSQVHHQFFKDVRPMVILNNVLILEVPNHFSAQWIHSHYHELVDVLLSVMDKKLSSYFVSKFERTNDKSFKFSKSLFESSAPKINSQNEE